jgi:hypothetical protein
MAPSEYSISVHAEVGRCADIGLSHAADADVGVDAAWVLGHVGVRHQGDHPLDVSDAGSFQVAS